ncbi:alpha/beta fold hydrolase [Streptomyces sp. NPDC055721]|uniref:alpha/beta fold hydrolase n=1 Tax=Streptomyces sp. NPDC127132 TaxID=3345374 RepID=UPI003644BA8F
MVAQHTDRLTEGVHTLDVDGLALRYHVHGTGPVCVMHPGGPGIAWEYLRTPELERSLTVVYLEPAGTGGSDRLATHPHGYTRELYSRHLAALIDHLAVGRVHLLGHSHGGFVAQHHALHRSDQLTGVVLYESAPGNGPEFGEEMTRKAGEFAARQAERPDVQPVMDAFAAIPGISDDKTMVAAAKGVLPAYVADYTTATPASALSGVFIYANPNHSIPVHPSGAPVQVAELTGTAKDTTSSVGNSTNLSMCFYEHKNYGGLEFRIGPRRVVGHDPLLDRQQDLVLPALLTGHRPPDTARKRQFPSGFGHPENAFVSRTTPATERKCVPSLNSSVSERCCAVIGTRRA